MRQADLLDDANEDRMTSVRDALIDIAEKTCLRAFEERNALLVREPLAISEALFPFGLSAEGQGRDDRGRSASRLTQKRAAMPTIGSMDAGGLVHT